jgi:hypothetical protein
MTDIQSLWRNEFGTPLKDGTPPHYHTDVRIVLDVGFPGRWMERKLNVEYPPRSPDLTPLHFLLWGALKTVVYISELQDLRCEIETACAAVPFATVQNVCQSVARRCNNALLVVGILNICDFKCDNITILSLFTFEL